MTSLVHAGFPGRPHRPTPSGHRARSFDYPRPALDEARSTRAGRPAPATAPSASSRRPRPVPRPGAAGRPAAARRRRADIDSPFLDLFGGARPGAAPRGRAPAPATREPPATPQPPAAVDRPPAPPPRAAAGRRSTRRRPGAPRAGAPAAGDAPRRTGATARPTRRRRPTRRAPRRQPGAAPPATGRPPAPAEPRTEPTAAGPSRRAGRRRRPAGAPAAARRTGAGRARADARARRRTAAPGPAGARRRPREPAAPPAAPREPAAGRSRPAVRAPKIKFKDRDPSVELAITEIAGHLTFTPNTVTAWYWLPEVRWAFRPDADREALLVAISEQYAGLAGFRLHLRRTTRPFPADEWARTLDRNTPRPLPDVPGAAALGRPPGRGPAAPAVGQPRRGPDLPRHHLRPARRWATRSPSGCCALFGRGAADGERAQAGPHGRAVRRGARRVRHARPAGHRRTSWSGCSTARWRSACRRRACSPRSTTGEWERGDLLALTEQIERYRTPYGSTVKLVNRLTGEERHVAVLTVGRMEPLEIPERHEPWLHFHERLPWPMELSSRVDILGPGDSFRNLEHRLRMIRSQQLDYAEHGMDAPPELERLAQRALVHRRRDDHRPAGRLVPGARLAPDRRRRPHPRGVPRTGPPGHPALLRGSCASRCSTRRTRTGWPASSSPASRSPTPATCAGCRSSCSPPRCRRPRPPSATGAAT